MVNSSRRKRIRQQRYNFLLAFLGSLLGLIIYIIGRHRIPFPSQWLSNIGNDGKTHKLFFSGVNIHLQVNFFLGFLFTLFSTEKMDQVKAKKWRYWISRGLVLVFSLMAGFFQFKEVLNNKLGDILLLGLIIIVINCCLLELLIQLMNQYGICNAFNLILFTDFLPIDWIRKGLTPLNFIALFLITIFFVWVTNLKWEVPVDTNNLYSQESKILKKKPSKLGFKLSFSFMPIIYLSQFLSFFHTLSRMRGKTVWTSPSSVYRSWGTEDAKKPRSVDDLKEGGGFWSSLFVLNEEKRIFHSESIMKWFSEYKWKIVGSLFFLIFIRWLIMWIQMRFVQWKTGEISKDLQKRGIYINGVRPGRYTDNLLKVIINKMVFLWNIIILIFNIIFDNLFKDLTFSNWFGGVNIGVDLIKQIRTKYRYIQTKG